MSATVHHVHGPNLVAGCAELIVTDGRPVALCFGQNAEPVAQRLAELLDRHGLADIPDTPAELTGYCRTCGATNGHPHWAGCTGWPAPDPASRKPAP